MLKKIMFTFLTLLMVYSVCVVAYRIFEPRDNQPTVDTSSYLAYDSLKSYIEQSTQNVHYLFFYSAINNNSIYLHDTIFSTVEKDTGKQLSSLIETVDITELDQTMETYRLSEDWSISSFPAFLSVSLENGEIIVNNVLEWTNAYPLTAQDIEDWMELNGLYEKTSNSD